MTQVIRQHHLAARRVIDFMIAPDAAERAGIAAALGLEALRKFRFVGRLTPLGQRDWELVADLGATVVQSCVVTLDPVRTRIDERVERRFLACMPEPSGDEVEMPEDENAEALGDAIDIGLVAVEALVLALPAFPRADAAALGDAGVLRAAPPGLEPLDDTPQRPFAKLAELRDRLDDKE